VVDGELQRLIPGIVDREQHAGLRLAHRRAGILSKLGARAHLDDREILQRDCGRLGRIG
jgi:hypothetical protein